MPQIFLIHFAGGSFYSFDFLKPHLTNYEFTPLELPGRGKRIKERLITDFEQAAKDISEKLQENIVSDEFLIYGHSMGAYLSLKVTSLLEAKGIKPKGILVSGNIGPIERSGLNYRYLLKEDELLSELEKIGGQANSAFCNKEYRDFFLPILRSDFQVAEKNSPADFEIVSVPIVALMGNDEQFKEKISNWKSYTSSEFNEYIMSGGHFFIYNSAKEIAKIIDGIFLK